MAGHIRFDADTREQGMGRTHSVAIRLLCTLLCVLGGLCGTLHAQAASTGTLRLSGGDSVVSLNPHLAYLHDVDATMRVAQADRIQRQGGFTAVPPGRNSFGFQSGAYWFHARVLNSGAEDIRWLLVQQYALSDDLEVHARYPDGSWKSAYGGDHRPFSSRSIRYRHPNFWLDLPRDAAVDIYVRIESESSMQIPLGLYTPTAFAEVSRDAQFAIGLYYGILLALFFYNLVLWLTTQDSSYFWYVFHLTAFGLVLFTLNGLGFEYLWPDSSWLADKSVPLSICLAQVGVQQFARKFLDLGNRWKRGDRIGLLLIAAFTLLGVASAFLPYRISVPIASAGVFVSTGWVAVEAIAVLRHGYTPAKIFLMAWAAFLIGTAMFAAVAFALLPKTFVTEYGVQIGSALEMLLLSIALGYRYASLRNENERIIRDGKQQLLHEVKERTSELQDALSQLGDAHARLRESSQRDALTGLHTRRYFHERLPLLLQEARARKAPLSLLMIDLDYFKAINDQHGHLAGDACLRWAARVLGTTLRPSQAVMARFGGEEFVVALPQHDLEAATRIAEKARLALASSECDSAEVPLRITTSIGVHEVDLDNEEGIDRALERADQALYRAKSDGRDCVRTTAEALPL